MNQQILKLKITNFRNLNEQVLEFSKKINCIFGENGNGKTNLLEAIYFLSEKKSFRKNTSFPQILSIDSELPEIIFYSSIYNNELQNYTGKITAETHEWYLNNTKIKNLKTFNSIFINPFDSYQFHNDSSYRRKLIDDFISDIDKFYRKNLNKYKKIITNRNVLLSKRPYEYQLLVENLDLQLIDIVFEILKSRMNFIEEINKFLTNTFYLIFSEKHKLVLNYKTKYFLDKNKIRELINKTREKDFLIGKTSYGVHRDDYLFEFDGFNSFEYCSLGQQKMSFLSLLFAYTEVFRYKLISYPVLLLDDVSGELDSVRWEKLIDYIFKKDFQVFITTANEAFDQKINKNNDTKRFKIINGIVNYL